MAYQFNLSYYYITQEHDDYLTAFSEASGDSRQTLIMQYVRGWLGRNRSYYEALARLDVAKRGISIDEWVSTVVSQGFDALPDYKQPIINGEISQNPLGHIILPSNTIKRESNYISLTKQNFVLLRTAIHFDGGRIAHFISKVIYEHLLRNWQALYANQVSAETSNNWLLAGEK
ncbi:MULTISPECIES: transposase [Nostoc]|jgi:hypothetical protein|uniref:Transposase n=2 Tax=Nostoc TaxID=1177 RepID=A0ABR8IKL2_9NOSO|nr:MULTISPECIES: transposase [Nostoc]MBD2565279.1 transposase [Nostoc linckia FACHB-391]MBD2651492.1 transposase [Nostoc foliaceum FACHB-393]